MHSFLTMEVVLGLTRSSLPWLPRAKPWVQRTTAKLVRLCCSPGVTPISVPSVLTAGDVADPNDYKFKVSFKSVTVEGDRAEVTYIKSGKGKTTYTFLVKTAAGWRIAGSR